MCNRNPVYPLFGISLWVFVTRARIKNLKRPNREGFNMAGVKSMSQSMRVAFETYLKGIEKLTNREASAEITANWSRIWDTAQPLGLTKREAQKAAWAYFKHERRQRLRELGDKRVRAA